MIENNVLPSVVIDKINALFQQYEPVLQQRQDAEIAQLFYSYWEQALLGQISYGIVLHDLQVWFGIIR